ncbi:Beta-monoglucosyldiacylglycerol synthase [Maioricimonas rarisocia]|uniref:Beta-monoglucosyldiacylglycerol synthase n=1 Tax=Maioricimonas rarisocia TaxID=2528026 RepID=A0A517Z0S9_9PLAN|nr:glycosyltransferase family 2 protein [Maioricimonas rarisocia]QDU36084.1 Beta-monoglucosyldiacylglycerol synthase [Maioricimonas rarisocia]
MDIFLQSVFWASLLAIVTTYFGYPLVLVLARPLRRRHVIDESLPPSVTLVISAYNEAGVIREKIENALSLDYPRDQMEVMVISDESDDGTDEIVTEYADQGVRLFRQVPRRGKSMGLTRFVPEITSDVIVFSDANSIYKEDAIRKLVRHFADPKVGFTVGHQRYYDDQTQTTESESLYWRYETFLKTEECQLTSVVCGDGAIYAIRSELFEPLREDDINDFYLPLRIVVRGYRGIFDPEAVCYEQTADDFQGEFRRKIRIVNRSLTAVLRVPQALNPLRVGVFAPQLFIHKVIRWFVPFFLVATLITNAILARSSSMYQLLLMAQLSFYGLALLHLIPGLSRLKLTYVPYYFCLINYAAFRGVIGSLTGRRIAVWQPERPPEQEAAAIVSPQPVATTVKDSSP